MIQIYTKHFSEKQIEKFLAFYHLSANGEVWKEIENTRGRYYISTLGRVISLCYRKPAVLKPQPWGNGYLCVEINGKKQRIHRLVANAFLDNPDNKPVVHHRDGNKHNNSLANLEWTTHKENTQYYYKSLEQNQKDEPGE